MKVEVDKRGVTRSLSLRYSVWAGPPASLSGRPVFLAKSAHFATEQDGSVVLALLILAS